ncbi:hypothetical protein HBI24_090560 [Parastagonospora nodorum]|nr:hypothetical protein HBH53_038590 [Parastagonospora nodorum]KAH3984250.1 hypothetical protein HBH51_028730 [Parastagonospora nodorum]KAH4036647.1 hypothetical protein HBI09_075600 [Parastagonospora nodorum]KAH4812862.1 hypothetical protein HBH61_082140 [Parastagonospora nodorum]KAH4900278.1 hypothetical protein HBI80_161170 [Parastagonospora nodorum]
MGQDLLPDTTVLSTIFPNSTPASVDVVSKTWTICTAKVHFDTAPAPHMPQDLIVRLETSTGKLASVTVLEDLARMYIPSLVPHSYGVGQATTADGRAIEYSLTEFVTGTEPLETVWPQLDITQKEDLMDAIVAAIKKLQGPLDSPQPHKNIRELLTDFISQHQFKKSATSSLTQTSDGITLTSALSSIDPISFTTEDLQALNDCAVFCHNDLEPRNVLVHRDPSGTYTLAAIIDWELAGTFPFAFESAFKDASFGQSNLHYDWYVLYKQKTRALIAPGDASQKLVKAVQLIFDSRRLQWKRNVGEEFRRRWMEREGVEMGVDGWVKGESAREWRFDGRENEELMKWVLGDFGIIPWKG